VTLEMMARMRVLRSETASDKSSRSANAPHAMVTARIALASVLCFQNVQVDSNDADGMLPNTLTQKVVW